MSIRIAATAFAFSLAVAVAPTCAFAQAGVMKECGAEYQTAKAANSLGGKKWQEFLADCRTRHAAAATPAAATAPAAPAAAPAPATAAAPPAGVSPSSKTPSATSQAKPTTGAKPATGGRAAMLDRQRACGAEWKAQKVELRKATPDLKWPQYWSACNKRMKAAAQ